MDFTGCQPRLDSDFSWRCQQRLGFERCQTKLGFKEVSITIGFWEMPSKVGFYGGANKDWTLTLLVGRTWLPNILKLKETIWIVYVDLRKQWCDCEKFQFFHLPWSYVIATCSDIPKDYSMQTLYVYKVVNISNIYKKDIGWLFHEDNWNKRKETQIVAAFESK